MTIMVEPYKIYPDGSALYVTLAGCQSCLKLSNAKTRSYRLEQSAEENVKLKIEFIADEAEMVNAENLSFFGFTIEKGRLNKQQKPQESGFYLGPELSENGTIKRKVNVEGSE